ncbi:uncharacterized protein RCC_12318 [Ramularia collo-cygni]|uniref:RRM domain-containing protein n=1 Tax=Ramularia collo-cygni TaxID=112498 RepID=A0A2D3UTY2_9PEZI|nr:uncharacterized protein RCC_12318 [Ramularia collo-cygni]CZT15347.1 uncharacterized protein RCC_12318 [Ramularia collo-cygni]
MDPYQWQQIQLQMRSQGFNPADPDHYDRFLQNARQPVYATNRTGPPVNVTRGWVVIEKRGIFVKNLNFKANEEAISNYFMRAGVILSLDLQRDHQTKKSKGSCVIMFDSAKSAQRAINMFDGKSFMDMRLLVREVKESTAVHTPSAAPAPPSQSTARNAGPPLIVTSTPRQSRRTAPRDGQL